MTSKPPEGGSPKLTGNETQVIDLSEVEVLVQQHNLDSQRNLEASQRSLPPPLPPSEVARASALPPSSAQPPRMSAPPPEPAPRSNAFYVVAIVAFLVIGVGGGMVIAKMLTKPAPPPAAPAVAATVITIPTVEMNDTDAGK